MSKKISMKLKEAIDEVLKEDPRTMRQEYLWTFLIKVLNKLGYRSYITLRKGIPSPESIITERRHILNSPDPKTGKPKYEEEIEPEEGVTFEPKREE